MCDTMVVVWPGGVGFAKNSDRDPNEAQRLEWIPAGVHAPGSELRCTWITIPQAPATRAVLLSRPFWMWGAEMGTNDAGVVIGNEAVFTRCPMNKTGLTGMDLVRLALERSGSADEAADVITKLIERHGQGGRAGYSKPGFTYHNSFLIADYRGAIVLEAAGKEVAIERITQGVRAISNGLTIPDLQHRADRLRGRVAQCHVRRSRMELIGKNAAAPKDLARALRDHGNDLTGSKGVNQDSQQPIYRRLNGALSAPCVHYGGLVAGSQTVASWISQLTKEEAQHWATGTSAPCISIFRPISIQHPRELCSPEGHPDPASLWWRFEGLHRRLMQDWSASEQLLAERNEIENRMFDGPQDQDSHWKAADEWLAKWEKRIEIREDRRPKWLQKRWAQVIAEAAEGNRLPPR